MSTGRKPIRPRWYFGLWTRLSLVVLGTLFGGLGLQVYLGHESGWHVFRGAIFGAGIGASIGAGIGGFVVFVSLCSYGCSWSAPSGPSWECL